MRISDSSSDVFSSDLSWLIAPVPDIAEPKSYAASVWWKLIVPVPGPKAIAPSMTPAAADASPAAPPTLTTSEVAAEPEERRVGKEWVRACRSRWWQCHKQKKHNSIESYQTYNI